MISEKIHPLHIQIQMQLASQLKICSDGPTISRFSEQNPSCPHDVRRNYKFDINASSLDTTAIQLEATRKNLVAVAVATTLRILFSSLKQRIRTREQVETIRSP